MTTGSRVSRPVQRAGTWAGSLLSPRDRFLPGLGARLGAWPRLSAGVLVALRALPTERLRASALRNVSTPLVTRMEARLEVPVSGGFRLRLDAADAACRELLVSGRHEPALATVFRRLLRPGDVCVDVGAHVGYFTLLASALVGPSGSVYSLEPDPGSHTALLENLALNAVGNVIALAAAAGAEDGEGVLHTVPPGNTGRAALRDGMPHGASVHVTVRSLASVLASEAAERLRLVKIDVEGTEADVLRGLEPLLAAGARPSVLVELHPGWWSEGTAEYLGEFCARTGLAPYALSGDFARAAPLRFEGLSRPQHALLTRVAGRAPPPRL